MPSGDWPIAPKRSETPLVEPKMLHGVELPKTDEPDVDNGQVGVSAPPAAASDAPTAATTEAPAAPAPEPPPAKPKAGASGASGASKPSSAPAPAKKAAARKAPARAWVEPKGSFCPSSHPVKAKLSSSIFHLPGMTAYERTTPDRCYKDEASAEADGLRKAKR
jgi:hypothetical protein